ncbi:MAG: 2-phospho-L-lactate transferase CofD family protein [Candidatus Firestonebacteria bacterium]
MKENKISKWIYHKVGIKLWIFIFLISLVLLYFGLKGMFGNVFPSLDFLKFISAKRFSSRVREIVILLTKLVTIDIIIVSLGLWGMYVAIKRGLYSVLTVLNPTEKNNFINTVYEKIKLKRGPNIVCLGGGEGIKTTLQGIKGYSSNISALVLPVNDNIRNAIVSLAGTTAVMNNLFKYKFSTSELNGFNFGDLFLSAMTDVTGNLSEALNESTRILSLRGGVVLLTSENVKLMVNKKKFSLEPANIKVNPLALKVIEKADAIFIGPGDLYLDILPNFLIKEIKETIENSRAIKVYIGSIMTQRHETVSQHLDEIFKYGGEGIIDYVVVNTGEIPEDILVKYRKFKSDVVVLDEEKVREKGVSLIKKNLVSIIENGYVRHNPYKLGKTLIKLVSL